MALSGENILLFGSILLFLSIVASKTSGKFGIPTLILFLIIGMLAGSDGIGGIYFNEPHTARLLGVVSLTFILFSGGLETKFESIRPILWDGLSLATIGGLITAVSVGVFSTYVLDFTLPEGLLLGAIVCSTDAAAVFSVLRFRKVGLKGTLRPLLEFESGSNDPMAYFLTISFITLVEQPDAPIISFIPKFLIGMAIGAVCGYGLGKAMVFIVNRIKLDIDGLYPVLVLALVLFSYSFTEVIGGNAFLTVYIVGIIMGNSNVIHKKSMVKFYDGQAWLMQIVMFVTLGLLVFPQQIVPIIPEGIIISLFLIFIARPISVFISLAFAKDMNFRKKLFISWVGLRGAAPIVFATYPLLAGIHHAGTIFHLVFFISASSVLLQGTTLPIMAKWLRVNVPEKIKRKFPLDFELKEDIKSVLIELDVPDTSPIIGRAIVEMNMPKSALIVLIHRNDKYITPSGETIIEGKDHLLVMAGSKETATQMYEMFGMLPGTH